MAKKRKKSKSSGGQGNPLLEKQQAYLKSLSENDRDNYFSDALVDPERRAQIWMDQADLGSNLVDQHSWATPDERAMRILKKFSPLVEIGCGANAYWCRVMKSAGVDVVGYDIKPDEGGKIDRSSQAAKQEHGFQVLNGGPEVLLKEHLKKRTLFLCYPDEETLQEAEDDDDDDEDDDEPQSLGSACLENFQGKHVIYVGELYGDTLSVDQAPWGRSSGYMFQQRLASEFHCLLKAKLTNWLHVRDTISVWKRSDTCSIVFDAEDDDDEEEEVEYKHIPKDERLPVDVAAPCLAHLLEESSSDAKAPVKPSQKSDMKEAPSHKTRDESVSPQTKDQGDSSKLSLKKNKEQLQKKDSLKETQNHEQKKPSQDQPIEQSTSGNKKKKKKKRKISDSLASDKSSSSNKGGDTTTCPW